MITPNSQEPISIKPSPVVTVTKEKLISIYNNNSPTNIKPFTSKSGSSGMLFAKDITP